MNTLITKKSGARELLLHVAEKLFAEYGFDRTSIRMIAGAAGLNLSLISYYFGSKHELLIEIFRIRLQQLNTALQAIPKLAGSVPDRLLGFIDVYAATTSNNKFYTLLNREFDFSDVSPVKDLIRNYWDNVLTTVKTLVNDGVKEGYFSSSDTHLAYFGILGLFTILVCESPLNEIINTHFDPGGQMFTVEKIKAYLYNTLQNNQVE